MEEMKKFLRYVVPGLVVIIEFAGLLSLFLLFEDKELLKTYIRRVLTYETGIGGAVGLFLISGGLGALLARVYHQLISFPPFDSFTADYSSLLKKYCDEKKLVRLCDWNDAPINFQQLSKLGQWRVLTAFWHATKQQSKFMKEAERRAETLHDIAHGQGTQILGCILVMGLLIIFDIVDRNLFFKFWYILPVFIMMLQAFALKTVFASIQTIMSNLYAKEFEAQKRIKVTLYICRHDLRGGDMRERLLLILSNIVAIILVIMVNYISQWQKINGFLKWESETFRTFFSSIAQSAAAFEAFIAVFLIFGLQKELEKEVTNKFILNSTLPFKLWIYIFLVSLFALGFLTSTGDGDNIFSKLVAVLLLVNIVYTLMKTKSFVQLALTIRQEKITGSGTVA